MRHLAIAVAVVLTVSAGATEAGFKGNYAAWKDMEKYGRLMYVQGLLDGFEGAQTSDDQDWQIATRKGWSDCGQALNLNAEMIEGAITRHYESHNRDWSIPPNAVQPGNGPNLFRLCECGPLETRLADVEDAIRGDDDTLQQ